MKQILQNLRDGTTELAEVPCPRLPGGALLIQTRCSLVSAGTERMLVDFGKAGPIAKARQQPDKVRMVLDKIRTDGLVPTVEAVRNKLEQPLPLGYCNAGVVQAVGAGVTGFAVGDRVASNGKHAEMVSVPVNLCARIPDSVSDEAAAFTVIGAIALQGIRLAQPTLGEALVVTGLGLIGLLTVQLLRANGCRVLGLDLDAEKLAVARQLGAETVDLSGGADPLAAAQRFSRGRGVDGVLITAATKSNTPVRQAAQMCRKRGRIVLVGVAGLELARADFYEKELSFQVSCSYGPGRYDPRYEEHGQDYPVGFVRWTEQRNFEAVLDMLADGRLDVAPLISHRFALAEAGRAYEVVAGAEPSLGILLRYPAADGSAEPALARQVERPPARRPASPAEARRDGRGGALPVSFIGSGNYATGVLIPAFKAAGARLVTVASSAGVSGAHAARKHGFARTTTDVESVLADPQAGALVITTRHDSHAELVLRGLQAGKPVFVEKPLCLTLEALERIAAMLGVALPEGEAAASAPPAGREAPLLMVGFNRRFAPQIARIKSLLAGVSGPKALVMMVNAGTIPADHWTQDPAVGGGRIIGEACHFIDLLRFLADARIADLDSAAMASPTRDTVSIRLRFADGSIGTVHYFANGSKAFPKERLEVFAAGRVLQLDNFRRLRGYGWPGFKPMTLWWQDKGQRACAAAFLEAVRSGGPAPIPPEELIEVSRAALEAAPCG